jgi:hypothetical protein
MPTKKTPNKTVKNSVAKKVVAKKTPAKQTKKYAAAKRKPVSKKPVAIKKPATKKAVAKKAVKKSPAKKTASKVNVRKGRQGELSKDKRRSSGGEGVLGQKAVAMKKPVKDMVYASDQESFWMQNGEILNSLMALNEAFAAMDKDIYQFHAHGDRNDFSIWVDSVLCDEECAADLKKAKSSKSARTIVVKHLKLYSI